MYRRRRVRPRGLRRRRRREARRSSTAATSRPGDVVIGLASSGPAFQRLLADPRDRRAWPRADLRRRRSTAHRRLGDALLAPTRIYVKPRARADATTLHVKGMAHITGGGLLENMPRVLPDGLQARARRVGAGRARRSSTGCRRTATSPTTRCTASSTAASAWCWSSRRSMRTARSRRWRTAASAGFASAIVALPAGERPTVVV